MDVDHEETDSCEEWDEELTDDNSLEESTDRLLLINALACRVREHCASRGLLLFNKSNLIDIFLREFC